MFKEIPASKSSISRRKLVYGVGVNDSEHTTSYKDAECPYYSRWVSMIARCYSDKYLKRYPTYRDCSVCEEWLIFSNFKEWMVKQDWQGKHLDKDLISTGNKVYSPETCLFISNEINGLLNTQQRRRGKLPQGVHFDKARNKFKAQCSVSGKVKALGRFESVKDAQLVYNEFKFNLINDLAKNESEPLKGYLISYAERNYNERNHNPLRGNS